MIDWSTDVGSAYLLPDIVDMTGIRREALILMDRNGENARVFIKNMLGPVAVMNIPIDHGDPFDPELGLRIFCRNGAVRADADPHAEIEFGQIGRASCRERVVQSV